MKKNVFTKSISLTLSVVQNLCILALVIIAVTSFSSKVPFLAQKGLQFYSITSGSMAPQIPTGSLVRVSNVQALELRIGDIITFSSQPSGDSSTVFVTHRITNIINKENNQYEFHTKGDANTKEDDQVVKPANVLGKYRGHVPYLGYVSKTVQKPLGFFLLILLPAVVLIAWEVVSLILHFKHHYASQQQMEPKEAHA